ncbi:hypothetical protein [Agrobacterium pusense]|uniref:hypothetical protein n=1 Tax=Agrobacterium pusense TaxID=648995 RepID=UPI0024472C26|nr:hypothetical protein [Agrobacterium pusense]MDH0871790.1 hypothetical protein [Agrobacterium pusense]
MTLITSTMLADSLPGGAQLWTRQDTDVEQGVLATAEWRIVRLVNSSDPLSDAVDLGITWLDKNKNRLGADHQVRRVAIQTFDGVVSHRISVSKGHEDADLVAPNGAVYARPYVRTYGDPTSRTGVITLALSRGGGTPGPAGSDGAPPSYEISDDGYMIRWSQPDGSVGPWLDIGSAAAEARDEADRSEAARVGAESARDQAAGYVNDIVSEKEVPIFGTATGFALVDIPDGMTEIEVTGYQTPGAGEIRYSRQGSEPLHPGKIQDASGNWFAVAERRIYVDMFGPVDPTGQVDSSAAFQKAADYARMTKCGRVWVRNGTYLVAGVIYGSFTIFTAENRGSVRLKVPSGANTFMFKTIGFDKWADSVPSVTAPVSNLRSYRWHSSPAGRNSAAAANNYVVGTIIVTNPVDPGITGDWENGEIWWQAISVNPATLVADREVDWEQVPSLLGSIFSGFEGITFLGNSAGQDAPYKGLCHYGVAPHFHKILGRDFGDWGLWWEVPGQVYSALVGIPLQGVWEDVRFSDCGTSTSGNIYDNGQSDTTRFYTMSYVTKNKGFMYYAGAKAGGGRHYGFHFWTDDSSSNDSHNWAIWSDAQASDWHGHAEGRVRLNGARHSGEFKIYKGSSAFRQNAPAIYLNNPSHCDIVARTHLFRNCFRIVGADGGYNRLAGFLSESVAGTGVVDLVFGEALSENTIVTALNNINASDRYQLGGPQNRFHRPSTLTRPAVADASDPTTGWSFSSQGLQAIVGGVEAFLVTPGEFVSRKPVRLLSYTVAALPTTGISAGATAYASNGRKVSEGAGAGTGVMVYYSTGQWRRFSDDSVVAA